MVTVWMVRHGETEWNAQHRFQGLTDLPLSERGRRQAIELRSRIADEHFDAVWSSDLRRAVETARLAHGEPTLDARIREMDFGRLEGSMWEEIDQETRRGLIEFDGFVSPGGESMAEMRERVVSFLDDLDDGCHLVVAHGGVIRLVARMCGADRFPGHTDVVIVDWNARSARIMDRPETRS